MKLSIQAGSTSQSVNIFIQDSSKTTGEGLTGLVFNSAGLTAYYTRSGTSTAATAITLATLAAANSAYSSGGFKEIDATNMPGLYRLDIPNAALASGAGRSVVIILKGATNMAPCVLEIELTAWNNQDAVRGGLTALPNANAAAAGGLFTRGTGAGQINQDANGRIDVRLVNCATDVITASAIATDAIGASELASDAITEIGNGVWASTTRILTAGTNIVLAKGTGITGFNDISAADVKTQVDAALSEAGQIIRNGTAQAGGSSTITLDAGASAINNFYQFSMVAIVSGTGAGQVRQIGGYTGSSKVATVDIAWATVPDNTSVFVILPFARVRLDDSAQGIIRGAVGLASANLDTQLSNIQADVVNLNGFNPTSDVVLSNVVLISGSSSAADNLEEGTEAIIVGAAVTGTLSTTQMTTNLTETANDQYNGRALIFKSGALNGVAVRITDYDGSTKMLTFDTIPSGQAPSNGDAFIIT